MTVLFNDRRPVGPRSRWEDYDTPLDRRSLRDANHRVRTTDPATLADMEDRARATERAIRRARKVTRGTEDQTTVGDYLDLINDHLTR